MYYIFIENGNINGCGQCPCEDDDIINFEVSQDLYNNFKQNPIKYIFQDNQIIENPDFDAVIENQKLKEKIEEVVEKLAILDSKRIRAVCEDEIKNEKTGETWLDYYNAQVYDLRIELQSLEAKL